jgi:hypothetical protein
MPAPYIQFADVNGKPVPGGKVCTYAAGSSTPLVAYKDSVGTLSTNPEVAVAMPKLRWTEVRR